MSISRGLAVDVACVQTYNPSCIDEGRSWEFAQKLIQWMSFCIHKLSPAFSSRQVVNRVMALVAVQSTAMDIVIAPAVPGVTDQEGERKYC